MKLDFHRFSLCTEGSVGPEMGYPGPTPGLMLVSNPELVIWFDTTLHHCVPVVMEF